MGFARPLSQHHHFSSTADLGHQFGLTVRPRVSLTQMIKPACRSERVFDYQIDTKLLKNQGIGGRGGFIQGGQSRGVGRPFWIFGFRFWIEEKGGHSGFFNPTSKMNLEALPLMSSCIVSTHILFRVC